MPTQFLNAEEKDILQEIMNIGFGRAAAELSDLIDLNVVLSIPEITLSPFCEAMMELSKKISDLSRFNIVEQRFFGDFQGSAFLVFSEDSGKQLLDVFTELESDETHLLNDAPLEREILLEVGNILMGACIGKIAELLQDTVTFSPPSISCHVTPEQFGSRMNCETHFAILMKTLFELKKRSITGYLFIVNPNRNLDWIKQATGRFVEQLLTC